jgi:hypothetical protein
MIYTYRVRTYNSHRSRDGVGLLFRVNFHEYETWFLTCRKEQRLRVPENRVLTRMCGPKKQEVTADGKNYIMRGFVTCTLHEILVR